MYGSCNSMNTVMTNIISMLKEVNEIVAACNGDTMPFEQAHLLARLTALISGRLPMLTPDITMPYSKRLPISLTRIGNVTVS